MSSSLTVRLPKSLHDGIKQLAKSEGISINQFLVTAAAEKMSALLTESYLKERALKGSKKSFLKAMSRVHDVEPSDEDKSQ